MHRRRSAAARAAVLALLAMLSSSCAFANPANRPVWNAFEDNLVPESDGAFWATLPLTAPVGVLAILVDTFVAHPLQVVDDAWDDTVSIGRICRSTRSTTRRARRCRSGRSGPR